MSNSPYVTQALEVFRKDQQVQAIVKSQATSEIADHLGESLESLEQRVLLEAFRKHAERKGTDIFRLSLDMTATPEQKKQELLKLHQNTADALGIDLDEYFLLNPHLKAETE